MSMETPLAGTSRNRRPWETSRMLAPELAEPARHAPEQARPVVGGDAEGGDAVVALELAHHHGGEDARVDVAAAEHEADALALEALGLRQHGRETRRARAFRHGPLVGSHRR